MFDVVECAKMRLAEQPHMDCEALRVLKNTMREVSVCGVSVSGKTVAIDHVDHGDTR
jgi:hypothetical protein